MLCCTRVVSFCVRIVLCCTRVVSCCVVFYSCCVVLYSCCLVLCFVVLSRVVTRIVFQTRSRSNVLILLIQIYPLWLCPFKLFNKPGLVKPHENKDIMYIDIGAYGSPKVATFKGPATMREIEKFVIENKGWVKMSYLSYVCLYSF